MTIKPEMSIVEFAKLTFGETELNDWQLRLLSELESAHKAGRPLAIASRHEPGRATMRKILREYQQKHLQK